MATHPAIGMLFQALFVAAGLASQADAVLVQSSTHDPSKNATMDTSALLLQTGAARAFAKYKTDFSRTYADGSDEHRLRAHIFSRRLAEIQAHNSHPVRRPWRAGVNHLTDRTEEELLQIRGYRRHREPRMEAHQSTKRTCGARSQKCHGENGGSCCDDLACGAKGICEPVGKLPEALDWSALLSTGTNVVDQGACGSCWAIAAAGAVELQAAMLSNNTLSLSAQGMLGCTPNPHQCGGTGGCDGATPELAFGWARDNGVRLLSHEAYTAKTDCPKSFLKGHPAVRISGYVRLHENRADQVLAALVKGGPLAIGVAGSHWTTYSSGVFNSCPEDPVVDHAVLLVGFGEDTEEKLHYWKIRNSWGPDFGEHGFIRLRRHAPKEKEPCGWDNDPQKGVGCKNGPKRIRVCGECGILSDVAYPVGTTVVSKA